MKRFLISFVPVVGLLAIASNGDAQSVEPVKICSLYGNGFFYIPGTDICTNAKNGDTRQQTPGGTWRTILPYKEGEWVTNPQQECASDGRLVKVGNFKSTDFTLNVYEKLQSYPVPLHIKPPEFITKVMMSGGFYDPRVAGARGGTGLSDLALCLRDIDPTVLEKQGNGTFTNPPYGLGLIPLGCIANSRIVGMPATYAVSAAGAYPQIDVYAPPADPNVVVGRISTEASSL